MKAFNITPPESFNIDTWAKGAYAVLVVTLPTFYYVSIKVISSIGTIERGMDAMLGFTYIFAIMVVLITDSRRYEFFPATTAYVAHLLSSVYASMRLIFLCQILCTSSCMGGATTPKPLRDYFSRT